MSDVKVKLHNQKAEEIGTEKLNSEIFNVEIKPELVSQAVIAQQANSRQVLAHAKDRSEVRGGGKKPWKQKGTGRARAGSSRSPIWIGGGVTFGPSKERNFSKDINKKMKRKAMFMSLSEKVKGNKFILIDKIDLKELKTKEMVAILNNFDKKIIKEEKELKNKTLFVLAKKEKDISRAIRNISNAQAIAENSLNIVDVLKYKYLFITVQALDEFQKRISK